MAKSKQKCFYESEIKTFQCFPFYILLYFILIQNQVKIGNHKILCEMERLPPAQSSLQVNEFWLKSLFAFHVYLIPDC